MRRTFDDSPTYFFSSAQRALEDPGVGPIAVVLVGAVAARYYQASKSVSLISKDIETPARTVGPPKEIPESSLVLDDTESSGRDVISMSKLFWDGGEGY